MDFTVSHGAWEPAPAPDWSAEPLAGGDALPAQRHEPARAPVDGAGPPPSRELAGHTLAVGLHPLNTGGRYHGRVLEPHACALQGPAAGTALRASREALRRRFPPPPWIDAHARSSAKRRRRKEAPPAPVPLELAEAAGCACGDAGCALAVQGMPRSGAGPGCRALASEFASSPPDGMDHGSHVASVVVRAGFRPDPAGAVRLHPPAARSEASREDALYGGGPSLPDARASEELLVVLRTDRPLALADTSALRGAAEDIRALVAAAGADAAAASAPPGWSEDEWASSVARVRGAGDGDGDAAAAASAALVGVVAAWQPMSTPRGLRKRWGGDVAAESRWLEGESSLLAGDRGSVGQVLWQVMGREGGAAVWRNRPVLVEAAGLDFVQAHRDGATVLFAEVARAVLDLVAGGGVLSPRPACLELFAGSGALTLAAAGVLGPSVTAELMPAAVARARAAIDADGAASVTALQADLSAEVGWQRVAAALPPGGAEVVLANPPRTGLPPFAVGAILERLRPRALIYVSCKPETLARDVRLLGGEYRLASAQPVDMFPHSPHVETVAVLVRRDIAAVAGAP